MSAVVLLLLSAGVAADPALEQIDVTPPRGFGYLIGDKFTRVVDLRVRKPFRLQTEALPSRGRVTHWLAIDAPDIDEQALQGSTQYRLEFTYQLINISPAVKDIALPQQVLQFTDGTATEQTFVPPGRVRVGVITDFAQADVRPDRPPANLPKPAARLMAWSALLLAAVAGLASLRWGFSLGQPRRPFALARRRLGRQRGQAWTEATYVAALREVHRAFNSTAGRTVFGESLAVLFEQAPRYAALARDIETFFARSRAWFFSEHGDVPRFEYSGAELAAFVARCADVERGLA